MHKYSVNELRDMYLKFFESKELSQNATYHRTQSNILNLFLYKPQSQILKDDQTNLLNH